MGHHSLMSCSFLCLSPEYTTDAKMNFRLLDVIKSQCPFKRGDLLKGLPKGENIPTTIQSTFPLASRAGDAALDLGG